MPFSKEFDGIWEHVIKPTVLAIGDKCQRADDIFAPGAIINDVIKLIDNSDYVVADLSDPNPNVYYELGFTHAREKPAILITQRLPALPFDLRHERVIVYKDSAAGAAALKVDLERYVAGL